LGVFIVNGGNRLLIEKKKYWGGIIKACVGNTGLPTSGQEIITIIF